MDLSKLNQQQRSAVEADEGALLILAGPGTGKTKTLTMRIAYLLEHRHVPPAEIVALTFTNKAAHEMRERLQHMLGPDKLLPTITTFHALGHSILQAHGNDKPLLSEPDHLKIIRALPKPPELKGRNPRELSLVISRAKTALTTPPSAAVRHLLGQYEEMVAQNDAYDFDDLLVKTYELLKAEPQSRPRYTYVHVDEFQDTSELQYELLKLLITTGNIFAIGDPNQAIYAFRGAGVAVFGQLQTDFPALQEINLTMNYRSSPEVVRLANAIFPHGTHLQAHRQDAGSVQTVQTLNEFSEAAYVINEIEQGIGGSDLLKAHANDASRQPRDYAVLYRTHRAGRTLQQAFADSGIPYQIAGEGSPYHTPAVQAVIACLAFWHDPKSAPAPEVPNLTVTQVKTLIKQIPASKSASDAATAIFAALGLPDDHAKQQFIGTLVQFGDDIAAALQHLDDISQSDFYDPTINAVTLLTIHASKGLEFEHVFLCAAEDSILPKLNTKGEGNIDEERRLFYVAVTRARDVLDITYVKTRNARPATISRFLKDLPANVLPRHPDPSMATLQRRLKKRQQKRAQTNLF